MNSIKNTTHDKRGLRKPIMYTALSLLTLNALAPTEAFAHSTIVMQQSQRISGNVIDDKGEPIIGANVTIVGKQIGVITDIDGNFSIDAADGDILDISYIGFVKQQVPARKNNSPLRIVLKEDTQNLDEVVIVGYGVQKKLNLTGAVDQIDKKTFQNRAISNVSQGLVGAVPNLNINMLDGKPTQSPQYNVRGTTSIGQGGSALVLIDGVEGDPALLNPNDIESISVLKDAASASIYGARGA
ncbi:MAG: carboxypeptidase-like regulatory domain-containing protein, partial [Tannerellaceae bacterium]